MKKKSNLAEKLEYTFDELPEDLKEKVIENRREINVNYDQWADLEIEEFKTKLEILGFKNPEVFYNGFYSQGDGASFKADIDIPKYIKNQLEELIKSQMNIFIIREVLNSDLYFDVRITQNGRYYHGKTMYIDFNAYDNENPTPKKDKFFKDLENYILSDAQELAKEFYKELQKSYEYLTSDEIIKETLLANEYKFNIDGDIV